jgi:hypothetical protein
MKRNDIKWIQTMTSNPSVSILLPTHPTPPEKEQDPVRLKNLVQEAANRLLEQFPRREIEPLLTNLENLVEEIDFTYSQRGLALYVSHEFATHVILPITVAERFEIGESFATRDLVRAINRTPRYWVLALSEQPTKLYLAERDYLEEIRQGAFPMTHNRPGGETRLPGGRGVNTSAYRDEHLKHFLRDVDKAFAEIFKDDPLPIVLVGVDVFLADFPTVSQHTDSIVGTLQGSHDSTPPHELAKLVWPVMKEELQRRQEADHQLLDTAVGANKFASGIHEVWQTAKEGRGEVLLVEEDYMVPVKLVADGMQVLVAEDPHDPETLPDGIDEIIETVISLGGRISFQPSGSLEAHQRIALTLRY